MSTTLDSSRDSGQRSLSSRWAVLVDRGLAPLVVLVGLVVVIGIFSPSFLSMKSITSVLDQSAILLLLALGQGMVILLGRIDLANAALVSFSAVILAQLLTSLGGVSIPLILAMTAAIGVLQGWLHTYFQIPSFIITLGTLGVVSGGALLLSGASTILVSENKGLVEWLYDRPAGLPAAFIVAVICGLLLMAVFSRSTWGKKVHAVGLNEKAASLSGIRSNRVVILGFGVDGLFSGLATIFLIAQLGTASPNIANSFLLPAIAAVIVGGVSIAGGVGGPGRIILGALIISLLRVGLDLLGVPDAFQPIFYGLITIIAIAITVNRTRMLTVTRWSYRICFTGRMGNDFRRL